MYVVFNNNLYNINTIMCKNIKCTILIYLSIFNEDDERKTISIVYIHN